jgi:2-polyprenyl-3-methyl-5-hydroxy-6-metoxy-1,4-benzoquinol methylase
MAAAAEKIDVDGDKLDEFANRVMGDVGSAFAVLLAYIGDQTGVFRSLRDQGPATVDTLAQRVNVDERYLLEWLSAQAAAGYVSYDASTRQFSISPEQATVLAAEGNPVCMQGLMQQIVGQFETHDKAIETFRSGAGRGWEDHTSCLFCATDRFFRAGYVANLTSSWLPSLDGIETRLKAGARVADVGCGLGSSTLTMAEAYPNSRFDGFDFHGPSIDQARQLAADAGLSGNTSFDTLAAKETPKNGYDLICMFDALHDMGDPVGAARRLLECLGEEGTLMLVEPMAGDSLEDNLHPFGQICYSASTLICTPTSKAQEVGLALGAQAGEKRISEVLREAGFTRIRRATETPTNIVLEARP